MREGAQIIQTNALPTSPFAIEKMINIPPHVVQRIIEEYEFFRNNEVNNNTLNDVQETDIWVSELFRLKFST